MSDKENEPDSTVEVTGEDWVKVSETAIVRSEKIRGKVAQILNSRQLVINRGSDAGVDVGMRFAILNSQGGQIPDPDTGEVLGFVDIPKVFVKVVSVMEKLSVASTFRTFTTSGGALWAGKALSAGQLFAEPVKSTETLRTEEATYKQELKPEDSYVHIGDPVVEVQGDEFSGWGLE
ncbi:hypothetical protein [Amycolatopsis balhimycina]|uniref:hypothetical protein n=1 Tax=Amycolatopsis balhimycina TaxID=208443 RepID=UPI000F790F57|nr:hypothetical protein [Amycolatopsis balhimycina]